MNRVLIVDDEPDVCRGLKLVLESEGIRAETAPSAEEALETLRHSPFDVVVSDYKLGGMDGMELLKKIKNEWPSTGIVMITAFGSIEGAVEAMSSGAFHYVTKPFVAEDLVSTVREALEETHLVRELEDLREQLSKDVGFGEIITQDRQMLEILAMVDKVAPTSAFVLLEGESGTGKELLARRIHSHSKRGQEQFVAINTGALPDTLLEGELFGYKKGAFTGANSDKAGYLAAASGGTIFLDEIGAMSASFQSRLLRVLELMEVTPLGSTTPIKVDLRVVSASNKSLADMVREGSFREDLYFRLGIVHVNVPPLRERQEDVSLLTEHFVKRCSEVYQMQPKEVTSSAHRLLSAYPWPGNVRELWNAVQRAFLLSEDENRIDASDIVLMGTTLPEGLVVPFFFGLPYEKAKQQITTAFQREYMTHLIQSSGGNLSQVARESGLTRAAVYRIIKKLGLELPR